MKDKTGSPDMQEAEKFQSEAEKELFAALKGNKRNINKKGRTTS